MSSLFYLRCSADTLHTPGSLKPCFTSGWTTVSKEMTRSGFFYMLDITVNTGSPYDFDVFDKILCAIVDWQGVSVCNLKCKMWHKKTHTHKNK